MEEPMLMHVSDLRARGATYTEVRHAVTGLDRISRGAYADTSALGPERRHLVAARAIVDSVGQVVTSHVTAAVNWDLPVLESMVGKVHVSPRDGRLGHPRRGPGYHMHTQRVGPDELVERAGLPTTSILRTVLDCGRLLDPDWGVVVADNALHRGLITGNELHRAAHAVRRLRGAERARALPARASALAESVGESLLRLRLVRMGLAPVEQVEMPWVEGRPRVDFLVDGWLVVEFDGKGKYEIGGDPAKAHWAEKLRDNRLVEAGHTVMHVIWAQLWDEARLALRINQVIAQGPQLRRPSA